jgi:glycerol kinase
LVGLTRGANKKHIVRAALESMAYQTFDIVKTMEKETGIPIGEMDVDGGATANNFLMQFQSDILNIELVRPQMVETTALGAAYLAGLQTGFWKNSDEILALKRPSQKFNPKMDSIKREQLLAGWQHALRQTMTR